MSEKPFRMNDNLQKFPGLSRTLHPYILLGLILLLGAFLRFYDLGAESYWFDEMGSLIESQQSIHQLFTVGRLDNPPAYYVPFIYWVKAFGTNEASVRSFSALIGVISILFMYLIGRELFGQTVGLLSAFLMATSVFYIYHSQSARYYSYFGFITLLSFYFLILALKSDKTIYYILYGVFSILMLYTHTYGVFIVVGQNLYFALNLKKYKNLLITWIVCQALILVAFLPYFLALTLKDSSIQGAAELNIGGLPVPSLLDLLRSIYHLILPSRGDRSWEGVVISYAAALVLLIVGAWVYAKRKGEKKRLPWAMVNSEIKEIPDLLDKLLLLSSWLVCAIVLPFIVSKVLVPVYADRYTICAAPALYLLISLVIFSFRKLVPVAISLGAIVILVTPGLYDYYATDVNEEWKEAALYVKGNIEPGDVVVFAPNHAPYSGLGFQQRLFNWYYKDSVQGCGLGDRQGFVDTNAIPEELSQCVTGYDRFWLVVRGTPQAIAPVKSFFVDSHPAGLHLLEEKQFVGISIYLFELAK